MPGPIAEIPPQVLEAFDPSWRHWPWEAVGGGWSGAAVWRGGEPTPRIALKAYPPPLQPGRLRQIHLWQQQASIIPYVPGLYVLQGAGRAGETFLEHAGRLWEATAWMPGVAVTTPSRQQVAAAAAALARLHACWPLQSWGMSPGMQHRWECLERVAETLPASRQWLSRYPHVAETLREAVERVKQHAPAARQWLRRWLESPLPLQPCLRDVRAAHVLFVGPDAPQVTGIVDFAAMAVDHPLWDLARLLGDYAAGSGPAVFVWGREAYLAAGGAGYQALVDELPQLSQVSTLAAMARWLERLHAGLWPQQNIHLVAQRLDALQQQFAASAVAV